MPVIVFTHVTNAEPFIHTFLPFIPDYLFALLAFPKVNSEDNNNLGTSAYKCSVL